MSKLDLAQRSCDRVPRPGTAKLRLDIPPDWFLGLPEEEMRPLCNKALHLARLITPGLKPISIEVRDKARAMWEQNHPEDVPPWRKNGKA